jgi:hypothetical protein
LKIRGRGIHRERRSADTLAWGNAEKSHMSGQSGFGTVRGLRQPWNIKLVWWGSGSTSVFLGMSDSTARPFETLLLPNIEPNCNIISLVGNFWALVGPGDPGPVPS